MIANYYNQINDDDLMPPESRQMYLRELQLQGDTPELAQFRLGQLLTGQRERKAIALRAKEVKEWTNSNDNN